jgi:hypothetical protein
VSSPALCVPLFAAAGLLLVSGGAKLHEPAAAAAALRRAGLPALPVAVRVAAVVELVVGAACLVRPAVGAPAVGALYLLFAVVTAVELRRGAGSCGCLGAVEVPPSPVQLALNLVLAGVALAASAAPPPGVASLLRLEVFGGAVVLAAAGVATFLCASVLVHAHPALIAYRRSAG